LIFGKIITIVANRGQILRLKCTKFYFSAPPDPLAGLNGPTSKGREGREGKGKGTGGGREKKWEGKGREEMYSSSTYF